jgi:membrane dipeptidase
VEVRQLSPPHSRLFPKARAVALGLSLTTLLIRLPARGAEASERPFAIVDLHVDLPYQYGYKARSFAQGSGQFPAASLRRAGVVGVVLPLFVPAKVARGGPRYEDLEASYQRVVVAITKSPVYASPGCAAPADKVRTWFAFEGAGPLAEHPENLAEWAQRGLRSLGLVHTRKNALASSSGDPRPDSEGLTAAGRALVRQAFALGLPVDVSHASERATADILAVARETHGVVIATHSNARSIADVPRNLDDETLRAVAASGGVVGLNLHSPFIVRGRRATLADVVRQALHLVRIAGPEHVALGSDFEGDIRPPEELSDVSKMPRLSSALLAAGLARGSVQRLFATNALRILCREPEPE